MTSFSSLRFRLVGTVFLAVAPASVLLYFADRYCRAHYGVDLPWTRVCDRAAGPGSSLVRGRALHSPPGPDSVQSGPTVGCRGSDQPGEAVAGTGANWATWRARSMRWPPRSKSASKNVSGLNETLLNRAFQQTVVAALGQFAMVSKDVSALLNQAVMLVAQTLEVEYCHVLELQPGGKFLLLRAGVGWKDGCVGKAVIPADPRTESGFTLPAGEAVTFEHLPGETRFRGSSLLTDHGVVSGISVAIAGHGQAFGILGALHHPPAKVHRGRDPLPLLARDRAGHGRGTDSDGKRIAETGRFRPVESQPRDGTGSRRHCHLFQRVPPLNSASAIGQDHPRALLPPNVQLTVRNCLTTGQSAAEPANGIRAVALCPGRSVQ